MKQVRTFFLVALGGIVLITGSALLVELSSNGFKIDPIIKNPASIFGIK